MMAMQDWNGREINVVKSEGGVVAVTDFSDNLIRIDAVPWPPRAVVQKLYESRQARAFAEDQLAAATKTLGVYSDLQSVHSEDAITWSYFGPLAVEPPDARAQFLNWLLQRLGLDEWSFNDVCSIDLWRRVPHSDKSLPGGPELDFVLDGNRCIVFGEVKWRSGEGQSQGLRRDKGQMQLRRDFLAKCGQAIYGQRGFLVLGVTRIGGIEANPPPDADGVFTGTIHWSDLATYSDHPRADEFARYLEWKQSHSLQ